MLSQRKCGMLQQMQTSYIARYVPMAHENQVGGPVLLQVANKSYLRKLLFLHVRRILLQSCNKLRIAYAMTVLKTEQLLKQKSVRTTFTM